MKRREILKSLGIVAAAAATPLPFILPYILKDNNHLATEVANRIKLVPVGGIVTIVKTAANKWVIFGMLDDEKSIKGKQINIDFSTSKGRTYEISK